MYSLTGVPVFVHQGDWIAGKACGCATIRHPELGLVDVWNTHFTALGGQSGPEQQRAFRASEAFELAELCRGSVDKQRHVLCMGDLNSLPESLCISLLRDYALLEDAYDSAAKAGASPGTITCDSPRNTWTRGKHLDELAERYGGKRLDYVLYRSPSTTASLQCVALNVVLDQHVPGLGVSYSDHFGVEAQLELGGASGTRASDAEPLVQTAALLREALIGASKQQKSHIAAFCAALAGVVAAVVASSCAVVWLSPGGSAGIVAAFGIATILMTWFGTTALYSGVVWGEWHKRACTLTRRNTRAYGAHRCQTGLRLVYSSTW